jgi:uncharacterized membrane protein YhaH (DUF805 family)
MFCPSCGSENIESAQFCGSCGKPIAIQNAGSGEIAVGQSMSFGQAISTCFSKYGVWQGRASRAEYWWFYLFVTLLAWTASIVDSVALDEQPITQAIVNLALLAPSISSMVRRLHDTNRSGWWFWIVLTIVGIPVLIYWLIKKGDENQNNYG